VQFIADDFLCGFLGRVGELRLDPRLGGLRELQPLEVEWGFRHQRATLCLVDMVNRTMDIDALPGPEGLLGGVVLRIDAGIQLVERDREGFRHQRRPSSGDVSLFQPVLDVLALAGFLTTDAPSYFSG
jgi:hypothetical protein